MQTLSAKGEPRSCPSGVLQPTTPLEFLVAEAVATRCRDSEPGAESLQKATPQCEPFHAIEAREVRDVPRRKGKAACTRERCLAHQSAGLILNFFYVSVGDGAHIRRQRIEDVPGKRKRARQSVRRRSHHDFRSTEEARRNASVPIVAADLPSATDDPSRRIVEPGAGASNLDFLSSWQPESTFDESVFEDDGDVLEILVDQCGAREAERHLYHFARLTINVDCSDGARLAVILGPDAHLVNVEDSVRQADLQRVTDREVVDLQSGGRQRVRNISHFVPFADPDEISEIVLNDAEVIPVVIDIGGKEKRVAASHDALLAQIGRSPVDFETQLVGLYDFRRLGKSLSKLCEERHVTVRRSFVIDERGVGELARSALGSALDERGGARVVPGLLCGKFASDEKHRDSSHRMAEPHWGKLVVFFSQRGS